MTASLPVPDEGTVARFVLLGDNEKDYHFAAVYAGDAWWITGTNVTFGKTRFTHKAFLKHVVGREGVYGFMYVKTWQKPEEWTP